MSDAFRALAGGFRLVYVGLVLVVLSVLVNAIGGPAANAVAQAQGAPPPQIGVPPQGPALVVATVAGLIALAGGVLGLLGRIRCLAVPDAVPGAKGKIVTSVALEAVGLTLAVAVNVDQSAVHALPMWASASGGLVATAINVTAGILFLLFTAAVARFIGRQDLARSTRTLLWLYGILLVLMVLLAGVLAWIIAQMGGLANLGDPPAQVRPQDVPPGAAAGGLVMCGLGCPAMVLGLVSVILYARLLIGMRQACLRYAVGGAAAEEAGWGASDPPAGGS